MYRQKFIDMLRENRAWFMVLGVLMVLLGAASIALPHVMTLTTELFIGSVIVVAGLIQMVHAFGKEKWGAVLMALIIGVFYTVGGLLILANPIVGVIALTILLAMVFLAEGLARLITGIRARPNEGWGWMIVSGLISMAAGILLGAGLPSTATWAVGLLVGVNFLMSGMSFMALSMAAGKDANAMSPAT